MGLLERIEAWLSGSVVELSTRRCPECERHLAEDDPRCPDCGEEPVEITEYVSMDWQMD